MNRFTPLLILSLFLPFTVLANFYQIHNSETRETTPATTVNEDVKSDSSDFIKRFWFKQLYVVFAGPYPTSPSSSFGHTFLLLEPEDSSQSYLLWSTINFGVATEGIHPVEQFYYGVFDTLIGKYTIISFYEKIREYSFIESRSLYAFPVRLTDTEKNDFLTLIYQEGKKNTGYNFVLNNCSTQLDNLFRKTFKNDTYLSGRIVSPQSLIDKNGTLSGRIGLPVLLPSIEEKIKNLSGSFSDTPEEIDTLDAVNSSYYLSLLEWKFQDRNQHLSNDEQHLIEKLRLLSASQKQARSTPFDVPPVFFDMHQPAEFGAGLSMINGSRSFILDYRMGLHDWYDWQDIYPSDNFLTFGELSAEVKNSALEINRVTVFRQLSLPPSTFFSEKFSWNFEFGLFKDVTEKYIGIKAGFGKTYGISDDFKFSALASLLPNYSITAKDYRLKSGPEFLIHWNSTESSASYTSLFYDFANENADVEALYLSTALAFRTGLFDIVKLHYSLIGMSGELKVTAHFYL